MEEVRRLLIDCGFGIRQLQTRLAQAQLQIEDLDAVFITHEHSDHIGCALAVAVRYRIPVWMSQGTYAALGAPDFDGMLRIAHDMEALDLGTFSALPFRSCWRTSMSVTWIWWSCTRSIG